MTRPGDRCVRLDEHLEAQMKIGMVGLGRMGGNLTGALLRQAVQAPAVVVAVAHVDVSAPAARCHARTGRIVESAWNMAACGGGWSGLACVGKALGLIRALPLRGALR